MDRLSESFFNVDRYDDREIVQTNLIESYERLMEFGRKHLPDKFFLEDDIFRIIMPLKDNYPDLNIYESTQSATQLKILKVESDMIALMEQKPELPQKQMAEQFNMKVNTVKYYITKLQKQGKIETIGSLWKGK